MTNKLVIFATISALILTLSWITYDQSEIKIEDSMTVSSLLEALGEDLSDKKPKPFVKGVSAEAGKTLFYEGFAQDEKGKKSKKQSKHFTCNACHNTAQEDPMLSKLDPQARLEYTDERGMPFLQGTTMYGAVSRETYYNDDYVKKYGELVKDARDDIRGAIQLCATECAQGRPLKEWELESMLAYLWSIDIKVGDLNLSQDDREKIEGKTLSNKEKVNLLKSYYAQSSPAHFALPPADRKAGTGLKGDAENGKRIYVNSCLHCHYKGKFSFLHLDTTRLTMKHLKKTAPTYFNHSVYQVTRWGVPSKYGKKSYMPHYPIEKLSDQQLTDLVAYINKAAS